MNIVLKNTIVFFVFFTINTVYSLAQTPIQKFWALNQCELIVPKLSVKPSAAYSLRKLFCNYAGYAINVRRDVDNQATDIGFTPRGDLDTTSLINFIDGATTAAAVSYTNSGGVQNPSITLSYTIASATITSISGQMNTAGLGLQTTFISTMSSISNGQTDTIGYYYGLSTYMVQAKFVFGNSNTIGITLSGAEYYLGNATGSVAALRSAYITPTLSVGLFNYYYIYSLSLTLSGTFKGGAYVTTWYDQSGNSNNLTQTTTIANQPQIASAGVVNRENGKPTIRFLSVYNEMYENNSINIQTFSAVRKAYKGALNDSMQYLVSVPSDQDFSIRSSSTTSWYYGDNNTNDFSYNTGGAMYVNNAATYYYTNLGLHCVCANSGTESNNTFSLSSSFANGGGDRPRGMYGGDPVSELIVFPSILTTTDRTRLYNDQKAYYGTN